MKAEYTLCKVIKKGKSDPEGVRFLDIREGDTIFVGGRALKVTEDAHYSGDASYDGYLLYAKYDDNIMAEGYFPDDLEMIGMTKDEIIARMKNGEHITDILPTSAGQLCTIYKADKFYSGDRVIYVPDLDLNEVIWEGGEDDETRLKDVLYTGNDFIDICGGNVRLARALFDYCDWQNPTSALNADFEAMDEQDWKDMCGCTKEEAMK